LGNSPPIQGVHDAGAQCCFRLKGAVQRYASSAAVYGEAAALAC